MAGLNIPRAERKVEDPSKVKTGVFRAPTAGTEAQQQLGGAIIRTAGALGQVADRVVAASERMEKAKTLNRSTAAANAVRQDLVEFKAKELNAVAGLDTEGNVKRLEDSYSESILNRTAELSDEEKALVNQELQADVLKDRTSFAVHQQKQLVGVTANNLDQSLNTSVQAVANNPTLETIDEAIKAMSVTVIKYDVIGAIDKEESEDRRTEGIEKIIETGVTSATLQDAESGQILLDQMKSALPAEKVKTLEADIRKQTKIQNDAVEAQRTEVVEAFTNQTIDLALKGAATLTQAQSSPVWGDLTDTEKEKIISIIENGSPFNKSDQIIRADFLTKISTAPLSLTEKDFNDAHGNGLSSNDYKTFINDWQTSVDEIKKGDVEDPLQDGFKKQAYRLIEFMRKDTAFIDPGGVLIGQSAEELAENDLRAAQQVNSLAKYIEENPGEDYVETYIKPVLKPVQESFVSKVYGQVSGFFSDEPFIEAEQDIEVRRQATDLLRESDVEATRENINRVSAQIREGNTELKILSKDDARRFFKAASGNTNEEKIENAMRAARAKGFVIP